MRTRLKVSLALAFVITAMGAAVSRADQRSDETDIQQIGVRWQDAWNKRDARAMTNLLAEDVDFVTVLGPKGWLRGRARFEEAHARMFTTLFTDSTWKTEETHVKWIQPDLAIARVLWSTTGDKVRHVKHGSPRSGIFTWVVQKMDGQWFIVASQNTESMPILPGQ
jgi:uncharacterized protein (TIGR02246 family)